MRIILRLWGAGIRGFKHIEPLNSPGVSIIVHCGTCYRPIITSLAEVLNDDHSSKALKLDAQMLIHWDVEIKPDA